MEKKCTPIHLCSEQHSLFSKQPLIELNIKLKHNTQHTNDKSSVALQISTERRRRLQSSLHWSFRLLRQDAPPNLHKAVTCCKYLKQTGTWDLLIIQTCISLWVWTDQLDDSLKALRQCGVIIWQHANPSSYVRVDSTVSLRPLVWMPAGSVRWTACIECTRVGLPHSQHPTVKRDAVDIGAATLLRHSAWQL